MIKVKNNRQFQTIKEELEERISSRFLNEKEKIQFCNDILLDLDSKLTVRKNMSIGSFRRLMANSSTLEEFKKYLNKLDVNKDYEIQDKKGIEVELNYLEYMKKHEKHEGHEEEYQEYKRFLDGAVKLNNNLYVILYI